MKNGGDPSYTSHNLFLCPDRLIETSPIDLATGVQRMAMMTMLEKAETAILRAADIMRTHVNDSKGHTKKNRIPFELVTFVSLERILDFLYVNGNRKRAIKVIASDLK